MSWEAAFISAVTALLVVILTNGLGVLLETRRRREKTLDYVCALHAEIVAGLRRASLQTRDEEVAYIVGNETPFGPADDTDFVFKSIEGDLSILPAEVIHELVWYYKLSMQSNLLVEALKDPLFLAQTADEKRKYMENCIAVLKEEEGAARQAITALEGYAVRHGLDLKQYSRHLALRATVSDQRNDGTAHG